MSRPQIEVTDQERYSDVNWRKNSKVSLYRDFIKKRIADIFVMGPSTIAEQWATNLLTKLENQLYMEAATKEEYVNPETLGHRLKMLFAFNVKDKRLTQLVNDVVALSETRTSFSPYRTMPNTSGRSLGHNNFNSSKQEANPFICFNNGGGTSNNAYSTVVHGLVTPYNKTNQLNSMNGQNAECSMFTFTSREYSVAPFNSNDLMRYGDSDETKSKENEDLLPYAKRLKKENSMCAFNGDGFSSGYDGDGFSCAFVPLTNETGFSGVPHSRTQIESPLAIDSEAMQLVNTDSLGLNFDCEVVEVQIRTKSVETQPRLEIDSEAIEVQIRTESIESQPRLEVDCEALEIQIKTKSIETQPRLKVDYKERIKTRSSFQETKGLTMSQFFTPEQMRKHLLSLSRQNDQIVFDKIKEKGDSTCQLCGLDQLNLMPTRIYCSACAISIKHNSKYYYTPDQNSTHYCFCTFCYKQSRGSKISFRGIYISKKELCKRKNDEEILEGWVQCGKCKGWQHQICGLYNELNDIEGNAEYICPKCWLKEMESKDSLHLSNSVVFGAKDLPKTKLSNHIEQRLFRRLKQEREERASVARKCFHEVPGAEDLIVRVVLSVERKLAVNKQLVDIFQAMEFPDEHTYTSKLILLFQKIEGVDVCIFVMYVQEFGSECSQPNQRCVYISYIDSVKYFTPHVEIASGEALRTFVYHEILIGYIDYVKKRGFATCYIWACPPLKGDDYILYCHPENQKTPQPNKLQQWYHTMLKKAANEKIVVKVTNLYEHFLVPNGEPNCKITAARLPCFKDDYWSEIVGKLINDIEKETNEKDPNKKIKPPPLRTLRAMGHNEASNNVIKDVLLMQKVGQAILKGKKEFIVFSLQHVCTSCHEFILSKERWSCHHCKNFHLCQRCHDLEQSLYPKDTHTSIEGEQHLLSQVLVDVASETKDEDDILENDLFENRQTFLNFCKNNHYQFDTLRRAKHSSLIMLYHLHKISQWQNDVV